MSADAKQLSAVSVEWRGVRLVASRFPPISLFEDLASIEDFDLLYAVQSLTNPRLRLEEGDLNNIPREDWVFGHGSSPVMASFCYVNRDGSRFSDGTFGVYYAASSLAAAVSEVAYHRERFLRDMDAPAVEVDMRSYWANVTEPMVDLREMHEAHLPDDYGPSRALGKTIRSEGAFGLLYRSVRFPDAECVAVFRPKAIQVPVVQGQHVSLIWDGKSIDSWYEKGDLAKVHKLQ